MRTGLAEESYLADCCFMWRRMHNTYHDIDGIIFNISSLFSQLTNVIEAIKNLRDHSALCPSVKSGTGTGASEISGHLDPSKGSGQEIKIS